jgi:hypothetical protein
MFSAQAVAQQGEPENDADEHARRFEVAAGPMVGWRHFRAQQGGRNALHLDSPMIGGAVDARYEVTHDESSRWSTLVTTGFSYAPIRWSIAGTAEPKGNVSGHHERDISMRAYSIRSCPASPAKCWPERASCLSGPRPTHTIQAAGI